MKEKMLLIKDKVSNMGAKTKVAITTACVMGASAVPAFAVEGEPVTPKIPVVDWSPVGNAITSGFDSVMAVMMGVAVTVVGGFALFKLGKKGVNKAI